MLLFAASAATTASLMSIVFHLIAVYVHAIDDVRAKKVPNAQMSIAYPVCIILFRIMQAV